ncbi:hypothetical protein BGY98DRAFT_1094053 [Russula aff. rugulosa BPL654]|nr:hypothetical protein BGY98DRAFT_1094053 [Russula aff. rugulosa BPL654]
MAASVGSSQTGGSDAGNIPANVSVNLAWPPTSISSVGAAVILVLSMYSAAAAADYIDRTFDPDDEVVKYFYRTHFFTPLTPSPSNSIVMPTSFEALVRDDFWCIVTGTYDYRSLAWSTEVKQEVTDSTA